MDFQKYQVDLLNKIESRHAISERVKEVFLSTPRHQFVDLQLKIYPFIQVKYK